MKKRFLVPLGVLLAAGLLLFAVIRFVQPQEQLDLQYRDVSVAAKIADMVSKRQFAVDLTDAEINDLLKQRLSEYPLVAPGVEVTGARFTREGNLLYADVNVLLRGRFQAGLRLTYALDWREPYLIAQYRDASIRGMTIPKKWLHPGDIRYNVNEQLPSRIGVKEIGFGAGSVRLRLNLRL